MDKKHYMDWKAGTCKIEVRNNMESFYTGRGDQGFTDTLDKRRISKADPIMHLVGTMDEFTSNIGMARAMINDKKLQEDLLHIQRNIIPFNAQLVGGQCYVDVSQIEQSEKMIDEYQQYLVEMNEFILPGETKPSAALDVARTVVRRAERIAVELKEQRQINEFTVIYLNRLSDLMYAMARYVELKEKITETVKKKIQVDNKLGLDCNDNVTLDIARLLAKRIEEKAIQMGMRIVIAVADNGGNLVLLHRMDDAFIASIDIAVNKAFTSVALKMTTEAVGQLSAPGQQLYGLQYTNHNRIVIFGGGVPLVNNQKIIGGLGVSGGTAEQDTELAEYGASVLKEVLHR